MRNIGMKESMMNNAFHWQGRPSVFTTGRGAADYNGINHARSTKGTANPDKRVIVFAKGHTRAPTRMGADNGDDMLIAGGRMGKK